MGFTVTIDTDNAAFCDSDKNEELARILEQIADDLRHGRESGPCMDINGNKVGMWSTNEE